jgi:hypothetical protein
MINAAQSYTPSITLDGLGDGALAETPGLTHSDPLPPASFPTATLPTDVSVSVVTAPSAESAPARLWSVERTALGSAMIELGDDYALNINQTAREVSVQNRATNEVTRIFGNAEVEIDGVRSYQFWGTTSFELANGVKITANTIADTANNGAYLLDRLTVTNDDHAVIVSNLADATATKVSAEVIVDEGPRDSKVWAADEYTRDGFVLRENEAGAGWLLERGNTVASQADLDATAVGATFEPGSTVMSHGEFGAFFNRIITQFMFFSSTFSMRSSATEMRNLDRARNDDHRASSDRASELRAVENRRIIELQFVQRADMVRDVSDFARLEALAA